MVSVIPVVPSAGFIMPVIFSLNAEARTSLNDSELSFISLYTSPSFTNLSEAVTSIYSLFSISAYVNLYCGISTFSPFVILATRSLYSDAGISPRR